MALGGVSNDLNLEELCDGFRERSRRFKTSGLGSGEFFSGFTSLVGGPWAGTSLASAKNVSNFFNKHCPSRPALTPQIVTA